MKKIIYVFVALVAFVACEKADADLSMKEQVYEQFREMNEGEGGGQGFFDSDFTPFDPSLTEWIDLGLPSGNLWASCNVGANEPTDFGKYYAWGEIKMKGSYTHENYAFYNGESYKNRDYVDVWPMSKYTEYTRNWDTRNPLLDAEDDVCTVVYGKPAHMPTVTEFNEMVNNTTVTFETKGTVEFVRFTGKNGNSIVLPLAGLCRDDVFYRGAINPRCASWGTSGYYWLNSRKIDGEILPNEDDAYYAGPMKKMYDMFGTLSLTLHSAFDRYQGMSVRAVKTAIKDSQAVI